MLQLAKQVFDKGYAEIQNTRPEWYPNHSDQDMETVNHILRVIVQNHDTNNFVDAFQALVDIQHEDGSYGNTSMEEPHSSDRVLDADVALCEQRPAGARPAH